MTNIYLASANTDFYDDLKMQINLFAPDFSINSEMPDIAVIDDDMAQYNLLRSRFPAVPVIFLTTDSEQGPVGDNLNIILKKPVFLMRLLDELRAANNRLDNSVEGYLTFNNYELRPNKKEIADLLSGDVTKLTEKEVCLIKYLYKTPERYISKTDLQKNVWQYNEDVTTHTIETHIYRLRQKVEKDEKRRLIITDNGGYKLNMDTPCQN